MPDSQTQTSGYKPTTSTKPMNTANQRAPATNWPVFIRGHSLISLSLMLFPSIPHQTAPDNGEMVTGYIACIFFAGLGVAFHFAALIDAAAGAGFLAAVMGATLSVAYQNFIVGGPRHFLVDFGWAGKGAYAGLFIGSVVRSLYNPKQPTINPKSSLATSTAKTE